MHLRDSQKRKLFLRPGRIHCQLVTNCDQKIVCPSDEHATLTTITLLEFAPEKLNRGVLDVRLPASWQAFIQRHRDSCKKPGATLGGVREER